jgi:ABC-type sugar transport system ATPase subunit
VSESDSPVDSRREDAAGPPLAEPHVILRLDGIEKSFPGVQALRGAKIEVRAGEVHALVGENGAGKSTLIKVMTGAHSPDRGSIIWEGAPAGIASPIDAQRIGIAAIYQEFNLVPALSVRENLFLGRETGRILDAATERRAAREILERIGAEIEPETLVRDLDLARQQLVEIARALLARARLLIMDEPTAALTPREVDRLLDVLRDLRGRGHGILFISHRLNEVTRIADRVTVMRDGATLGTWAASEMPQDRMITLMVGRTLEQGFPKRVEPSAAQVAGSVSPTTTTPPELLVVRGLRGGRVRDVSFTLRAGEVVGLAGLVGAGRTDVARMIFGADRLDAGAIHVDGRPVDIRSPRDAIRLGICLLTEDRKGQGLLLGLSARDNFAISNLAHWSRRGWINPRRETSAFMRYVASLNIRVSGPEQEARNLSGGNQQKLLVARWLESDSRIVIFDEPTRGIDVGAKWEMYNLIRDLAARGKGILMISSELPEVIGMSDRILVMHEGRITGVVEDPTSTTQEDVLRLAVA